VYGGSDKPFWGAQEWVAALKAFAVSPPALKSVIEGTEKTKLDEFPKECKMRRTKLLLLCLCWLIAAVSAALGQTANSQVKPGILGYLNPETGAFRPFTPVVQDDAEAATATVFTGTVSVTITINVKTTSLTNFTCNIAVSTSDGTALSAVGFEEGNTVAATGTGSTRTCKLSIPYSWSLTTPSTDVMTTTYSVLGSTGTNGLPQRSSSRFPLDTRKVPANGAITSLTAAVTQ
jgi:hypothetical protein